MTYKSTIVITKEGTWFVARSIELGVTSQGKTVEESKRNLTEAIELYLEDSPRSIRLLHKENPLVTSIEVGRG